MTPFKILFEDNHVLVVVKPAGVPSQGDETGDESLLDQVKEYIRLTYKKPGEAFTALVHRLDRPVGGVMVLGKTSKAAARLSAQFQNREVQKSYFAITENIPEEKSNQLTHYLKQMAGKNIVKTFREGTRDAKKAILDYEVIQTNGSRALIYAKPQTGRRHQIRVQLSAIKCTIVGDVKYGKTEFLPDLSIALFSGELSFKHPVKEKMMTFNENPPNIFPWTLFEWN